MVLGGEAGFARRFVDDRRDRLLHRGRGREIFDLAAVRTHQVVVMSGEVLRQLVAGEIVAGRHAVHDTRLFEHHEIAVRGALREAGLRVEDFGNRQRTRRRRQHVDDLAARRCEPLRVGLQTVGNFVVQARCPGHPGKCTG